MGFVYLSAVIVGLGLFTQWLQLIRYRRQLRVAKEKGNDFDTKS